MREKDFRELYRRHMVNDIYSNNALELRLKPLEARVARMSNMIKVLLSKSVKNTSNIVLEASVQNVPVINYLNDTYVV